MLYNFEGKPQQAPVQQQPQMPTIAPKVGGTVSTTQPVPQQGAPQQNIQAEPVYQQPSFGQTAQNVATNTAVNYGVNQASGMLGGGAPSAPVVVNGTGTGIAGPAGGASGTAGSGVFGANGATLGSAGVGLAGAGTAAYMGAGGMDAYQKIQGGKDTEGWAQAAMLSNPVTAWAWPAVGPVFDLFDTGKPEDQQRRDDVRGGLRHVGILTENNEFVMPDGRTWYSGNDGSTPEYQVQNANNPVTKRVVGAAQVMAALMVGEPGKDAEDLTGQLTNMALSTGGSYSQAMDNLLFQFGKFADSAKLTPEIARKTVDHWVEEKKISPADADAYKAALTSFIEGNPWQFTDDDAAKELEGVGPAAEATFSYDPSANLSGSSMPSANATTPQAGKVLIKPDAQMPGMHTLPQNISPQSVPQAAQGVSGSPAPSVPQGGRPPIFINDGSKQPLHNQPRLRNIQAQINSGR